MENAVRKTNLKAQFLELLSKDRKFRVQVIEFISKHKNGILTTTYLDRALEKLSRKFDEKLLKQSERLSKGFDEKLSKQSKDFDEKLSKQSKDFDEKLSKQSKDFDEKLSKQSKDFDKKLSKLSEDFDEKLSKQSKDFDEKLSKQSKDFDEKLSKQSKDFDEKLSKLSKDFDEKLLKLRQDMMNDIKQYFDSRIGKMGSRWGMKMEESIRLGLKTLLEREFNAKVSKWEHRGIIEEVSTKRGQYEIDVYITTNGDVILCEVKSFLREGDVENFYRNCLAYEIVEKKSVSRKIIITSEVEDEDVKRLADDYSIEIVYKDL